MTFCSTRSMVRPVFFRRCQGLKQGEGQQGGEPQGELVQHEDCGFGHQTPAHGHHLLFAAAQGAGLLAGPFLEAGKEFVNLVQVLIERGPGPGGEGPHFQVLVDGHFGEQLAAFGDQHHAGIGPGMGGQVGNVFP